MLRMGLQIRSTRDPRLAGTIVGYGFIKWPESKNLSGDDQLQLVYLVKVAEGSSALGQACVAMREEYISVVFEFEPS